MAIALAWLFTHDDLLAATEGFVKTGMTKGRNILPLCCIISPFSFQTEGVPDVVLVLFVEFIVGDRAKRLSPEDDSLFY